MLLSAKTLNIREYVERSNIYNNLSNIGTPDHGHFSYRLPLIEQGSRVALYPVASYMNCSERYLSRA